MFDITLHQHALERAQILNDAREGVQKDQFELYYQPIMNCSTGRCDQIEALLRWHHPQRGLLAAESFRDVFLDAALAQVMSPRLVKSFRNDMRMWNTSLDAYPNLTINLSRLDLLNIGFQNDLEAEIKRQGQGIRLRAGNIGKRSGGQALRSRAATPSGTDKIGFRLTLDDFGLGTLPLSVLRTISFTQAKISRKLVKTLKPTRRRVM